jgi:SWI/SNF-related matrix-associated actin-dependent regulator of chromatin subfamily A-like protein 1
MWRKRRKLPPTIQVHLLDDNRVEVFPRRMKPEQKILVQNVLKQDKRRQRYQVSNIAALPLQKMCHDNEWDYEGVPLIILQLKDQLVQRTLADFETDNPPKPLFTDLWKKLHPHQQMGVLQIIQYYKGRALLADDMGLGKTHQGVALALYYRHEGNILIVCPSYLRYHWEDAMIRHGKVRADDIQVVQSTGEAPARGVVIVSYDMLPREGNEKLRKGKYNMLMCDESHYVKNRKAKRTEAVAKISRIAKRCIFMSGTPALNRPVELFAQMHMIRPAFANYYTHFAKRYCNAQMTDFGMDDRGHSCDEELHWLLKKVYMVRRIKRDVLQSLPKKTRHTIMLEINEKLLSDINEGFKKWKNINRELIYIKDDANKMKKNHERKTLVSELFRLTGEAKIEAVKRWTQQMLDTGETFLFFGYHMKMLDAIEKIVKDQDISYMRIDGSTPAEKRQSNIGKFQEGRCQVAILSIMAAGTGLTLTAASTVVFGELWHVPGVMLQAEDRVHRISQTSPVDVYHLLGKNTIDDRVYNNLIEKLKTLDALVDKRGDRTLKGETTTEFDESLIEL